MGSSPWRTSRCSAGVMVGDKVVVGMVVEGGWDFVEEGVDCVEVV